MATVCGECELVRSAHDLTSVSFAHVANVKYRLVRSEQMVSKQQTRLPHILLVDRASPRLSALVGDHSFSSSSVGFSTLPVKSCSVFPTLSLDFHHFTTANHWSAMVQLVRVSTCNLNQWSLDFGLNLRNIQHSITLARQQHSRFRTGPELELSGYGCEDHYYEADTLLHCWQALLQLLTGDWTDDMLVDVGMPLLHKGVRYNCRLFLLNRRILLIRPKLFLADDGNYREARYFTPWHDHCSLDTHHLPDFITAATTQQTAPIGIAYLALKDCSLGCETCEELFTPRAPHIDLTLNGVEIITNSSGSHHSLRKLQQRLHLIQTASAKCGGAYLYANQRGCDGGRLYYDGCACIHVNGDMIVQTRQFDVRDVEVVTATIDLDDIRSLRASVVSRNNQAAVTPPMHKIIVDFTLTVPSTAPIYAAANPIQPLIHSPEEEIAYGPACWLWDYLRRSGARGYFLPLSGGADSAATAAIIGSMCHLVHRACVEGDRVVLADVTRLLSLPPLPPPSAPAAQPTATSSLPDTFPADFSPSLIANHIFYTCYLATSNSGTTTRDHAAALAKDIGANHLNVNIDAAVSAITTILSTTLRYTLRYKTQGGTQTDNIALQNIQARLRMVVSYALAALLPSVRGGGGGGLLVLGSANVDESLRGYFTKYDCSSADVNPIGGICKNDLKSFLAFAHTHFHYPALDAILHATPTAELEPTTAEYVQTDEVDMGMTYEELGVYGKLRKIYRCGPLSMYNKLKHTWYDRCGQDVKAVADKVKRFFYYYAINRHKMTILTPSYHAEAYGCDDNRYDHRQFLYNAKWGWQFEAVDKQMDEDVARERREGRGPTGAAGDGKGGEGGAGDEQKGEPAQDGRGKAAGGAEDTDKNAGKDNQHTGLSEGPVVATK